MNPMIKIGFNEVLETVPQLFKNHLTPILWGNPGMGKSAAIKAVADKYKLKLIDVRLSSCTPEDFTGLPFIKDGKSTYAPFDWIPTANDTVPSGYNGWILFLDELGLAKPSVQKPLYKLIYDREVNQEPIHPNLFIAAASNYPESGCLVEELSYALKRRLVHLHVDLTFKEWSENLYSQISTEVLGFLRWKTDMFYQFNDEIEYAYPNPSSWIQVSKFTNPSIHLLAGLVGDHAAYEYKAYLEVFNSLPSKEDVLNGTAEVPSKSSVKYAVMSWLPTWINESNHFQVIKYMSKFPVEMQAFALKDATSRNPKCKTWEGVIDWVMSLG